MNAMVVYLPTTAAGVTLAYDFTRTTGNESHSDHASVPAALLPATARGGEVVAVVPAALLSWHSVELPKGIRAGSARLQQVLQGLLEDQLLDEPTQLHLALGPAASAGDGRVWVAVCDKSWLRGHLEALEAAERRVSRVVPEFAPDTGVLRLNVISEAGLPQLIITGGATKGVMRLPLTTAALALVPKTLGDEEILFFAEPEVAEVAEQLLQRTVDLTTRSQRWLEAARTPWDLAQFDLASSSRLHRVKRLTDFFRALLQAPVGRPARWGFVLLLVIQLAGINIWSWQVQNTLQARRAGLSSTLTQTFPQVKLVVDAPLQMERELTLLRQASGAITGRDLEPVLSTLGSVTGADQSLNAIDFVSGEIRLKGLQLGAPDAARISEQLQRKGLTARLDGDTFFIQQVVQAGGSR